jgi:transcriptional regulator with PAS, ATPase and Fis domain
VHRGLKELERRERHVARRERELNLMRERVARFAAAKRFIAGSAAMQDVLELAASVAPLDTTALVYGESGTGKEFIVRLIHEQSPRASGPFVSINCAALTETLLESELFGHVRGAFTVKVNARVVAATNRDLRAAVAAGTFREDLYFRLAAFVITVPPLRERREDIPALVHDFLGRAAARVKKEVRNVSADAMTALMNYSWPGNVRELEHAIERAVIVARGTSIKVRELPPEVSQKGRMRPTDDSLDLQAQERTTIERALQRFDGNRRQAADALKISTVTLWRKMKQYGLGA